jgi:hypothetical protein
MSDIKVQLPKFYGKPSSDNDYVSVAWRQFY